MIKLHAFCLAFIFERQGAGYIRGVRHWRTRNLVVEDAEWKFTWRACAQRRARDAAERGEVWGGWPHDLERIALDFY